MRRSRLFVIFRQSAAAKGLFYCPFADIIAASGDPALDGSQEVSKILHQLETLWLTTVSPLVIMHPGPESLERDSISCSPAMASSS